MAESFNNARVVITGTTIQDVYQAPTGGGNVAVVLSCLVSNVHASASTDATVTVTDSSNTSAVKLINLVPIPAKATLEVIANKLILKAGEKLRVTSSAANNLEVTVSALEIV